MAWAYCPPGVSFQAVVDRVSDLRLQSAKNNDIAECSPLTKESRWGGCHCSRCEGDKGTNSKGKELEEN